MTLRCRRHRWGQPNRWKTGVFKPYLPNIDEFISKKDPYTGRPRTVRHAARLLQQSWGGWLPANPMTAFVL